VPTDTRRYTIIKEVFSTVTSPVFSELIIVLGLGDIIHLYQQFTLFHTLRMMNEVRPFKLVFLLEFLCSREEGGRGRSVEALSSVTEKGYFDFLDSTPTIRFV